MAAAYTYRGQTGSDELGRERGAILRRSWRLLMLLGLLAGLVPLLPVGVAMADDAVVGTGTAISCDDTAFNTALATAQTGGGGTITFNCGGPATIWFLGEKTITTGNSVIIDGADLITLHGNNLTRFFFVEAGASLDLRDLTLSNGRAIGGNGGAVYNDDGTLTITGSTITGSSAANVGGAIWSRGSTTIVDSTFTGNSTVNVGGAIISRGSTTIVDSTFTGNLAGNGGGAVDVEGTTTINGSTFTGNSAGNVGGALATEDMTTITGSTFTGNSARLGGALVTEDMTTITGSTFTDNTAEDGGGAIYGDDVLIVDSSTFTGNSLIEADQGGAIYMSASVGDQLDITGSTFTENEAGLGGAVYNRNAAATITNSQFIDNSASKSGGAIYNDSAAMTIDEGSFTGNEAGPPLTFVAGGAIYNTGVLEITSTSFDENVADDYGGAIWNSGQLDVIGSSFTQNAVTDSDGGAISSTDNGVVTISASTFTDNYADAYGGAIAIFGNSSLEIEESIFTRNIANDGSGGALAFFGTTATIINSTFTGNQVIDPAGDNGGGIRFDGNGSMTIFGSTISSNSATGTGGGIEAGVGNLTIDSSTISGNWADKGGGGLRITDPGTKTITNSTIAFNDSDLNSGDGILTEFGGVAVLRNTIIAENDTAGSGVDCSSAITSNGYNLDSDNTCGLGGGAGDIPGGTADLGPLQDNGGYTETHLLQAGSDALDNGDPNCPAFDQRGLPRPSGAGCDIGAVEVQISDYPLCVQAGTALLMSPLNGAGCAPNQYEIVTPLAGPTTFCISPWSGAVYYLFGTPCPPVFGVHTLPDNGDLLTCVNGYTTANRRVFDHAQCTAIETPNTIPAP